MHEISNLFHGRFTHKTARFWLAKMINLWSKVKSCCSPLLLRSTFKNHFKIVYFCLWNGFRISVLHDVYTLKYYPQKVKSLQHICLEGKNIRTTWMCKIIKELWNCRAFLRTKRVWKLQEFRNYRNSQKHESTLLHTYVVKKNLTADRSCTAKYFWKTSYRSW